MTIAIITDTDSSLPPALAEKFHIQQVPISIQFGEDVFYTNVDIDDKQVFKRIDVEEKLPTTAAPSPGSFVDAYKQAFESEPVEAIICLCVSGEISATYSAAKLAAQEFPEKRIEVVDTRSLTMGQGFMAIAAAEALQGGASIDEAVAVAMDTGRRAHVYGALATLKYLSMSGRVSHLAAGMAGILNIKPILAMQNGKLDLLEKVRTQKKAWARVIELVKQDVGSMEIERMAILHVTAEEDARKFKKILQESVPCPQDMPFVQLTPGLSIHTGAGLVGVAFVTKK